MFQSRGEGAVPGPPTNPPDLSALKGTPVKTFAIIALLADAPVAVVLSVVRAVDETEAWIASLEAAQYVDYSVATAIEVDTVEGLPEAVEAARSILAGVGPLPVIALPEDTPENHVPGQMPLPLEWPGLDTP